ncbi:MAG: tyrosine-type recombinase/integrase [Candidatus Acidiferrales bacterium]
MTKIPGIFERPPQSGVHWISYFDCEGKRRREKAGKLTAALDLLAERRLQVKKGEFIPPRQTRAWTFRKLAEETIKRKALRLSPATIETDLTRLSQLIPIIGGVRFDRITPERIEQLLGGLKGKGLTNSTLNRYRSFISSVFAHALKSNLISMNPVARVGRYRENDSRLRWLKPDEEERLRGALMTTMAARAARMWEFDLALYTGIRRGEQWNLKWKDVDLERGNITVKGKTGRRHVLANASALASLRKLHALTSEQEFVSPDNDGSQKRDWRTWFREACAEANVENFHWHDLRHTFASRLVMAGVDIRTVQELLGHKSIVQTMRYAHLSVDHRTAAVEKINALTEAAV